MKLFVDGRDIHEIIWGNLDTGEYKKYSSEPDGYLGCLDDFLRNCGQTIDSLTEGHIMIGEGSATALRASLAIMNTLRFTQHIELIAYRAPQDQKDLFSQIHSSAMIGEHIVGYASPVYEHRSYVMKKII